MANNSDPIIPRDIADPDRVVYRADYRQSGVARYLQRLGEQVRNDHGEIVFEGDKSLVGAGTTFAQLALQTERQLERDVRQLRARQLDPDSLTSELREGRRVRESTLQAAFDGATRTHRETVARISEDFKHIAAFDEAGEREIRALLMQMPEPERKTFIEQNRDSATVLAAVVRAPWRIVNDSVRSNALDAYNRQFRREQFQAMQQAEFFVGTLAEIRDSVLRDFDDIAPRPYAVVRK
jgi:hypothetical protein